MIIDDKLWWIVITFGSDVEWQLGIETFELLCSALHYILTCQNVVGSVAGVVQDPCTLPLPAPTPQ